MGFFQIKDNFIIHLRNNSVEDKRPINLSLRGSRSLILPRCLKRLVDVETECNCDMVKGGGGESAGSTGVKCSSSITFHRIFFFPLLS